jgi:prepilin-type N-terminal cleavage/methylation domain-containing protein
MHTRRNSPRPPQKGYSLVELLVVIALLAVLAGIAINYYGGIPRAAEGSLGGQTVAALNNAVLAYNTANRELVRPRGAEMEVVQLLQTPDTGLPGAPYLDDTVVYTTSSSPGRLRAQWNGRFFTLLPRGVDGSGIDLESKP